MGQRPLRHGGIFIYSFSKDRSGRHMVMVASLCRRMTTAEVSSLIPERGGGKQRGMGDGWTLVGDGGGAMWW